MNPFLRLVPWLFFGCLFGCVDLPNVPAGVCGNGVLEPENGEECDGYAPVGQHCGSPSDEDKHCRYECSAEYACPKAMSCGLDGMCRRGSGAYAPWVELLPQKSHALQLGDLDGNGRADLLALGDPNPQGQSMPTVMFFDENGVQLGLPFNLQAGVRSPMLAPVVTANTDEPPRQQLIVGTSFGIAALAADDERRFFSLPYAFQTLPTAAEYRMIPARGVAGTPMKAAVLIYLSSAGYTLLLDGATNRTLGTFEHSVAELSGDPVAGDLNDSNVNSHCDEVVLAYRTTSGIYAHRFCDSNASLLESTASPRVVAALPNAHAAGSEVQLVDVNGDRHLDLLVADQVGCPYLAFGRGDGTFSADPSAPAATASMMWPVVTLGSQCPDRTEQNFSEYPLAVGQLNESDLPDWVLPSGVALVASMNPDVTRSRIVLDTYPGNAPFMHSSWSVARVEQLTDDEHLDLVAGSSQASGLDLLIGVGKERFNPTWLQSDGPTLKMVTGDYDGDGINDVALVQDLASGGSRPTGLALTYSATANAPSAPTEIATLPSVEQLTTGNYETDDAIEELGVLTKTLDATATQLTLFVGNRGQCPVSSLGLWRPLGESSQSDMARAEGGAPVALTVGHFVDANRMSFLALAKDDCQGTICANEYRLWFAPDAQIGNLEAPSEVISAPEFVHFRAAAAPAPYFVIGDLDSTDDGPGGAIDDALLLTAGPDENQVSLWRVPMPLATSPLTWLSATTGRLTADSSPMLVDLDRDNLLDLVFLLSDPTSAQQGLYVVWNDGGTLDLATATPILPDGKPVRGVARRKVSESEGLFVVAEGGVYAATWPNEKDRDYQIAPVTLSSQTTSSLAGASAIAVGDMTGDGLADLALAVQGGISIFKELEKTAP